MDCRHFDAGRCRSCTWLPVPYAGQLARKQRHAEETLAAVGRAPEAWLEPVRSAEQGFRNKAKMVVAGPAEAPTLGILDPAGDGVDLRDCGLHTPGLRSALPELAAFVSRARLTPYDVARRRGELKHLLVTESPDGELMVRFVLRSQEAVARIRKHLPTLLGTLPVRVASVNLQPEHKAVLEGEREIVLTPAEVLRMRLTAPDTGATIELALRPQGFFQTNTAVAAELYAQVRRWAEERDPATVWDLYCGVGGFAVHLARRGRRVVGVETSAAAVRAAAAVAPPGVELRAGDAASYAVAHRGDPPDLVVVNPPRRGIGSLAAWLEASAVPRVVYSSCRVESLAGDLAAMPSLRPVRARLLDMFPQTPHHEVVVELERR